MNVGGAVSERLRFGLLLIWLMKHVVTAVCAVGGVSGRKAFQQITKVTNLKPQNGTRSAKIISALAS